MRPCWFSWRSSRSAFFTVLFCWRTRVQWLRADNMQHVDLNHAIRNVALHRTGNSDHGRAFADEQEVGMANFVGRAVSQDDPKRLKWLFLERISQIFCIHNVDSK